MDRSKAARAALMLARPKRDLGGGLPYSTGATPAMPSTPSMLGGPFKVRGGMSAPRGGGGGDSPFGGGIPGLNDGGGGEGAGGNGSGNSAAGSNAAAGTGAAATGDSGTGTAGDGDGQRRGGRVRRADGGGVPLLPERPDVAQYRAMDPDARDAWKSDRDWRSGNDRILKPGDPQRDANFRNWFGDSKIVDKTGAPLRAYHISNKNFTRFIPGGSYNEKEHESGPATWLSPYADRQPAGHHVGGYEGNFKPGTNVMPLHVAMKNPLVLDHRAAMDRAKEILGDTHMGQFPLMLTRTQINRLEEAGHDGIVYAGSNAVLRDEPAYQTHALGEHPDHNEEIISFRPQTQLKSAIGNRGRYGRQDNDIRYATGGSVPDPTVDYALRLCRATGGPVDLQNLRPTDTGSTTVSDLSSAFQKAIDYHTSLSPQARVANSKDAMAKVGNYAGFYKGTTKPFSLLGKNQKLEKTESGYDGAKPVTLPDGRPIAAAGVSLSPAVQFGKFNTCPNHASCKESCLGKTSGGNFLYGGGHDLEAYKGPRLVGLNKTKALVNEPGAFATRLYDEVDARKRLAAKEGKHLGVRLNVISDLHPRITQALIKAHPDVTFYDYTKLNSNPVAPNHHLTYSSTGVSQFAGQNGLDHDVENPHSNWRTVRSRLDGGSNVAMAFTHGKHLPETVHDAETGKTYKVIDGDTHDYRPLDAQPEGADGVVIGLRNKNMATKSAAAYKNAAKNSKGFMVHYDPQLSAAGKGQKPEPTNKTVVIAPQPKRTAGLVGHNGGPPLE